MEFRGKTVLVTGGGGGIGRTIALTMAEAGARVVVFDRDRAGAEETARLSGAEPVAGDVAVSADVARAFAVAEAVDILVNNAATCVGDAPLHELSEERWDAIQATCLKGVFLCTRAALPKMMERGAGVIVNISSVNALTGIALPAYSAAKGGINSLTRVLAAQYAMHGIRVNAICPGTILSESSERYYEQHPAVAASLRALYPGGKFGRNEDIASAVRYLASDQAAFINGAIFAIDGGLTAVRPLRWEE